MISNADEARMVVSRAKFPPTGVRGQGSPFACFAYGLATPFDYVAQANGSTLTMVQIETAAGVENIDEICQVEGVGMLFIPFSKRKLSANTAFSKTSYLLVRMILHWL